MERAQILRRLEIKLAKAREWRDRIRREFDTNVTHGTGIPHTCGASAVRSSASEYVRAIKAADKALHEHTDFIVHGKIPDDLNSEIDDEGFSGE